MYDFTIVTPSYNMLDYLKLCVASVRDQKDVKVEHIVVDGGSTDGTIEWLNQQNDIVSIIEKDRGMYDALNKGFKIAKGQYIGHLNCDEQYLHNKLLFIKESFDKNNSTDIVYGNIIKINHDGSFNSYRKSLRYNKYYILSSYLYISTCALFYRRDVLNSGLLFDISFRSVGDAEFLIRLGDKGYNFKYVNHYISAFTVHDCNLSQQSISIAEQRVLENKYMINSYVKAYYNVRRIIEKIVTLKYINVSSMVYSIYTKESINDRQAFIGNPIYRIKTFPN